MVQHVGPPPPVGPELGQRMGPVALGQPLGLCVADPPGVAVARRSEAAPGLPQAGDRRPGDQAASARARGHPRHLEDLGRDYGMTLRIICLTTDATVIAGAVGGYVTDMLPPLAALAALIYSLMLIGEWLGLWRRPRR